MALIRIRELSDTSNDTQDTNTVPVAIQATISIDHETEYSIILHNPFNRKEEERLEWYFEQHLRLPFLDTALAQQAEQSIKNYGEDLFKQLFSEPRIYAAYKDCIRNGLNSVQFEIVGSPSFHSWHWEALKDPDWPHPLSLETMMVRKQLQPHIIDAPVRSSPTINLLIVTARPFGNRDIGYRTISRPLVEALHQAKLPIEIHILRPGTYKALENHLRDITDHHGVGYYHVIHFDAHGAVLAYNEFKQGYQADTHLYGKNRYGRSPLQPYAGHQAFLFLDSEQNSQADAVSAPELAQLLISHQIPIAILNACQSGKQIGANETSLGNHLLQAGIQLVVAMCYSVTVSAAILMM